MFNFLSKIPSKKPKKSVSDFHPGFPLGSYEAGHEFIHGEGNVSLGYNAGSKHCLTEKNVVLQPSLPWPSADV